MSIKSLIALSSLILLFISCDDNPHISLEENAKQQFGTLPGKIGITLKSSSGEWHHVIQRGDLLTIDSLPKAPSHAAVILRESFDPPAGLPPQQGYEYWGAYLASPDKRFIAAAIAVQRHASRSPGFVIVDMQANRTMAVIKLTGDHNVDSLAWSHDSKRVVALNSSSELGALDRLLINLTGHANPKMTWYLDVANLNGDIVAHTKLAELRGSWGWVVWLE